MWFNTSAVASAPSLTFSISVFPVASIVSVTSGPSVTVALAVSWNKTSQLKLYIRGRPFAFGRRGVGGGGVFPKPLVIIAAKRC